MTEQGIDRLVLEIRRTIQETQEGNIPFSKFMELCLYHPDYGYYRSARPKIGKDGDFYTPSNVGGITAELLAGYYAQQIANFPGAWTFAEFGGGTGRMARIILDTLQASHPLDYARTTYAVVETSPYHKMLQKEELKGHLANVVFVEEADWRVSGYGGKGNPVFVLAQELLDAFPVRRIRQREDGLKEFYVIWDEAAGRFDEMEKPCTDPVIVAYLQRNKIHLRPGQTAEVNLLADQWVAERLSEMDKGYILAIDYGDLAAEIYAPHRFAGTLMCYRRHMASDDPYTLPGQQDITAHVNFTACMEVAKEAGADLVKLWKQRDFLLEQGALDLLTSHAETDPFSPVAKRNRAIRQLLLGDRMGDLFKVLLLGKGISS